MGVRIYKSLKTDSERQNWHPAFCCVRFPFVVFASDRKDSSPGEVEVLVTQSCPTLCDPMDCSPPGSSVHGILQARILKWVAMPFSGGWGCDSYAALWFASSSVLTPLLFFLFLICVCTHFLVFLLFHLFTFILFLAMPQGMQDQTCGPCIGSTES